MTYYDAYSSGHFDRRSSKLLGNHEARHSERGPDRSAQFREVNALQSSNPPSPKGRNYPGVPSSNVSACWLASVEIKSIDLPGVYSLTPYSEDERVAVDVLTGKMEGLPRPDAILLSARCKPSLPSTGLLAAPVIALGLPTLVLLNMADVFARGGGSLDVLKLAAELGRPGCHGERNSGHRTGRRRTIPARGS